MRGQRGRILWLVMAKPPSTRMHPQKYKNPPRTWKALYLAVRCQSGPAWPSRSTPTGCQHPGRIAPGPGRARRRRGGWPSQWCSRARLHARGRAACGRGHCAGWPNLPLWGWQASGCTACGPPSCARAGGCCSPLGCSVCLRK